MRQCGSASSTSSRDGMSPISASGASGNVARVGGRPYARVVGVAVAPGDVAADQARLGGVVGGVGAGEREVAQRPELRLDAVQPGRVERRVGELYVVGGRPLANLVALHGLIGDLHTVALVGSDGTIDWYCCPRFDSPSFFAAILNADRGALCLARLRRLELQEA